jgi:energy-coupling factor transporter ATP-binding protein EcfA2
LGRATHPSAAPPDRPPTKTVLNRGRAGYYRADPWRLPVAMQLKTNPFTPGKRLTRPELFAGRTEQLEAGVRLLVQAGGGNVRHGLITGDRGIGKSSLSSQIQGIAQRDDGHLRLVGLSAPEFPYTFLVAEHVAQRGQTVADVAAGLLREINRVRGTSKGMKLGDFELDFKVIRAKLVERDGGAAPDVTVAFVDEIEQIWKNSEGTDGIALVVDEVDRVAEDPGMATFFKVSTEMMSARGLENIMILAVGSVGVQELLKADHSSVVRIFETIHLPLLSPEESMAIVDRALSGTGVSIERAVNQDIAFVAGGFPNPVHVIGSEAFDADDDDCIDEEDVAIAIERVVTEKWKEQFDANYIEAGSGKHRDIVKTMAGYDEPDVPSKYICDELGVRQPQISSNINELMKRDVIVRVERGVYRLKDPLFRIYVQYLNVLGDEPVERRPRKRRA